MSKRNSKPLRAMARLFDGDHVAMLMEVYGDILAYKEERRLADIFSPNIVYAERSGIVLEGLSAVRKYWRTQVGAMKDILCTPLETHRYVGRGQWLVDFRCAFNKENKAHEHEWTAIIKLNRSGKISLFQAWADVPFQSLLDPPACVPESVGKCRGIDAWIAANRRKRAAKKGHASAKGRGYR